MLSLSISKLRSRPQSRKPKSQTPQTKATTRRPYDLPYPTCDISMTHKPDKLCRSPELPMRLHCPISSITGLKLSSAQARDAGTSQIHGFTDSIRARAVQELRIMLAVAASMALQTVTSDFRWTGHCGSGRAAKDIMQSSS